MSRMESITGSTEVIESTPIMMNEMNIVESKEVISASVRVSFFRIGMKTLPSSNAIIIDSTYREQADAKQLG
jgi:hypothetical protein